MNPTEAFLAELGQESTATRKILASAPADQYAWRPHEKGMSLGELCGHIAGILQNMPEFLGRESFDIAQRPEPVPPPATREETLERFDLGLERSQGWLAGLGDSVGETWRLVRGEDEMMAMPRAAAIRAFLLNHVYHHRGQLSTYLRAMGEPVPSVYGPTADVNPFDA